MKRLRLNTCHSSRVLRAVSKRNTRKHATLTAEGILQMGLRHPNLQCGFEINVTVHPCR